MLKAHPNWKKNCPKPKDNEIRLRFWIWIKWKLKFCDSKNGKKIKSKFSSLNQILTEKNSQKIQASTYVVQSQILRSFGKELAYIWIVVCLNDFSSRQECRFCCKHFIIYWLSESICLYCRVSTSHFFAGHRLFCPSWATFEMSICPPKLLYTLCLQLQSMFASIAYYSPLCKLVNCNATNKH